MGYLRPDADDADGAWTNEAGGTSLFASVDDTSANDADYIQSSDDPSSDICRFRLSDPAGALTPPGKIRVRYKRSGTGSIDLTVRLKQGTTEIASWVLTDIAATFTTSEQTLTSGQYAAITDFNNLFVELQADSAGSKFPDATNTGHVNAPGYPGSLTTWPGGDATTDDATYEFYDIPGGLAVGSSGTPVSNVTFRGCRFRAFGDLNVVVFGDNITFEYCTFAPEALAPPPVSHAAGYGYGIAANGAYLAFVERLTVRYCDIWGFANAIDAAGSTQAKPHVFEHNYIHDARDDDGGADHTDGIGALNNDQVSSYVVINHNTIESVANTNAIAFQFSSTGFHHFTITNNLLGGWNYAINFGGVYPDTVNSTAHHITFTGNTFSTRLLHGFGVVYQEWWLTTGSSWSNNRWMVPSGAVWGTPARDGLYWIPFAGVDDDDDSVHTSSTDYSG